MKLFCAAMLALLLQGCAIAVSCPPTGCVFGGLAANITGLETSAPAPVHAPEPDGRRANAGN